jgi:HEAT repeat protein
MIRSLLLVVCLTCPAIAAAQLAPAPAVAIDEGRAAAIARQLVRIEGEVPATWVRGLGAADRAILFLLAEDPARALVVRRRAVLALRHLAEPAVRALLERRASDPSEDAIVSRYALRALALGFGEEAFDAIVARLGDARAHVREGAAEALVLADPARARAALEGALAVETSPFVRRTIERLLAG